MSTHAMTAISGPAFPYPGLRPFEPDESHLFFGRDEHVFEMFSLLEDHRFLAVVGASGSGKSSLVRAGLLPRLRDEGLINQQDGAWRFLIMRPGNSPLDALADACHRLDSLTGTTLAQGALHGGDPVMTRVVLESGPKGLVRILADARVPDNDNILLLVDQFEEIFRFAGSEVSAASAASLSWNESLQFVALLLKTASQTERPVHVVLTMRTDFIGDCDQFGGLPEAINAGQFLVPRLSWRQQELAITGPLQLPGFESHIDRAIVDHMLNAASKERDALPLVQHALLRMWLAAPGSDAKFSLDGETERTARHITETEHYWPIGGLAHALDLHATDLYRSLTKGQQRIAECLFRCLGERSPKGPLTRRLTSVQEVAGVADVTPQEVIDVVEVYRQPGVHFLVTSPAGAVTPSSSIDISHESLLRQWKLLQHWIEAEFEAATGYRRLTDAVNQGERLMRGIRLDRAVEWRDSVCPTPAWAKRYDGAEETADGGLPKCLQLIDDSLGAQKVRRQAAARAHLEREKAQARQLEAARVFSPDKHSLRALLLRQSPWLVSGIVIMIPHIAAGYFNYFYNEVAMSRLDTDQPMKEYIRHFHKVLSWCFNAVAFPLGFLIALWRLLPMIRVIQAVQRGDKSTSEGISATLSLPQHAAFIGGGFWIAAGLFYSLVLTLRFEEFNAFDGMQIFVSMLICGGIAATYPFFGLAILGTLVYYPRLVRDAMKDPQFDVRRDKMIARSEAWLLAGSGVPLLGIALLISDADDHKGFLLALVALTASGLLASLLAYKQLVIHWDRMAKVLSTKLLSGVPGAPDED